MNDRRRATARSVLTRIGRAALTGLTAMGSCWGGGYALAATARQTRRYLDEPDDDDVRDQARRGIAEIEAYLAVVDPPARRIEEPKRHRRRGEPA
jgi:hypothetical protein